MDRKKIKDFLEAYESAVGLEDAKVKSYLEELMFNIISKYEKILPNGIPKSSIIGNTDVYLIKADSNDIYSVENFFLNRLMRNINAYEIGDTDKEDSHLKGSYTPAYQKLSMYFDVLKKALNSYKELLKDNFDDNLENSIKKVVMHEFEHALQTNLDGGLYGYYSREGGDYAHHKGNQQGLYTEIVKNLKNNGVLDKYKAELTLSHNLDAIKAQNTTKGRFDSPDYYSNGVHISSNYAKGKPKNGYRGVNEGLENLDETLNETECLEMSKHNTNLCLEYSYKGIDFYLPLRNAESSNQSITIFGDLFKIAFGMKNSFELMYLDPVKGLEKFNLEFNDIFQNYYKDKSKDAIEILSEKLIAIKSAKTKTPEEQLKQVRNYVDLTNVFAKCLEKRVQQFLSSGSASNTVKQAMLNSITAFRKGLIYSTNKDINNTSFTFNKILDDLSKTIVAQTVSQNL